MNEEITKLARDAGLLIEYGEWRISDRRLERFAELVATSEREACCDIVDYELDTNGHAKAIKIAIRARSKK